MNIIELAREAGLKVGTNISGVTLVGSPSTPGIAHISIDEMERFVALVLEEAAKVCDEKAGQVFPATTRGLGFSFSQQWDAARSEDRQCAAAIRALKGSKE